MQKVEGVSAVQVSLNEGMLTLRFVPANRVSVAAIRATIRSNGFTPKDAEVRVTGRVVARGDSLFLVVPGSNEELVLEDEPNAPGRVADVRRAYAGASALLSGVVPESPRRTARLRLRVRSALPARSVPALPTRSSSGKE